MFTKIKLTATSIVSTGILALCILAMSPASAESVVLEEGIESSTSDVRLPGNDLSSFRIRTCADCTPMTLKLSVGTGYEANGQAVDYTLFRELSKQHAKNMMAFYDPNTMRVTRMTLSGVAMDSH